uniref:Uncharacterized protein n=1 Tax=Cacopsylla melanoneura TaxID=428564 RepID=A0A8D8Y3W2_9HEMI
MHHHTNCQAQILIQNILLQFPILRVWYQIPRSQINQYSQAWTMFYQCSHTCNTKRVAVGNFQIVQHCQRVELEDFQHKGIVWNRTVSHDNGFYLVTKPE